MTRFSCRNFMPFSAQSVLTAFAFLLVFNPIFAEAVDTRTPMKPEFEVYFTQPEIGKSGGIDTALVDMIDGAQTRIDASIFQLQRQPVINALERAARRLGPCNVRLITDLGYRDEPGYTQGYQQLERAGITIVDETCAGRADSDLFMHNKYVIADLNYVWTGSYNVTEFGSLVFHENAVKVHSPDLALGFLEEYNEMWGSPDCIPGCGRGSRFGWIKSPSSRNNFDVNGTLVEAYFTPGDSARDEIIDHINNSVQGIYFCIFAFTRTDIADAMLQRLNDGVVVQGVFDELQTDNNFNQYPVMQGIADVKIHSEVDPHGALLHHKFMVLDPFGPDPRVITGAYNWSSSAESRNDENILVIHDRAVAEAYYCEVYRRYHGEECDPSMFPTPMPQPTPTSDPTR